MIPKGKGSPVFVKLSQQLQANAQQQDPPFERDGNVATATTVPITRNEIKNHESDSPVAILCLVVPLIFSIIVNFILENQKLDMMQERRNKRH